MEAGLSPVKTSLHSKPYSHKRPMLFISQGIHFTNLQGSKSRG